MRIPIRITTIILAMLCFNLAYDPTILGLPAYGLAVLFFLYSILVALIVMGIVTASKRPYNDLENVYHRTLAIQVVVIQISAIPFALPKQIL